MRHFRVMGLLLVVALSAVPAVAQTTVFLSSSSNREVWRGETAGDAFGTSLDRGELNNDSRRDLIVGAPNWNAHQGRVYVHFSGPVSGGEVLAASAAVILTGGASDDLFGSATAAGWITTKEAAVPQLSRDLVIGAPGANGGAGAIYVFRGDEFVNGARLSVADAFLTINGDTGDHAGTALATGDMDGDGYRDIIIGAPGNNRVYVIKGGPAVTGTVNLSSQSPLTRIDGPAGVGVGSVLAAGDITGDTSYDVAIGAPDAAPAGAVYVVAGSAVGMAPVVNLATDATAKFTGIDAGDHAGAKLAIGPFDTDSKWDLAIAAPDAAGPSNARPGAGEVYVVWGRSAVTSRSLATADVTILGAGSGFHTGAALAMGDVDGSGAYDIAMLASGASGIGEVHVVLGRARALLPAVIDLNNGIDRRVIADPAAGQMQSVLVYDHTGEGSEDIVAGFPGAGQGKVYVSFSPSPQGTMIFPASGSSIGGVSTPFQWNAGTNADAYRLTVGTAPGGSDLFDSGETGATSLAMPALPRGQTLYLRLGSRIAGLWRNVDSTFVVLPAATFAYPTNNITGVRPNVFSWSSVGSGATYELLVGSTQGASDVLDSGTMSTTSYRVFSLPAGRTLFARVISSANGAWTATDVSFTTAPSGTPGGDAAGHGIGTNFAGSIGGDALLYNSGSGAWSLQVTTPSGFTGVDSGVWSAGWVIKSGDFNGDGLADLFFYDPTSGRAFKALNTGSGQFSFVPFTWSPGWSVYVADLNGDGRADVFVYNTSNGRWFRCISQADDSFAYTNGGTWSPNWSIYPGDFNGDGRADLFLYNASADSNRGRWYRVLSNSDESFTYVEGDVVWRNDWTITPGDFNGDGITDLFLYRSTGEWYRVLFTAGGTVYEQGLWSTGWSISKGDFNADGRADLFVYNPSTGRWFVVITEANGSLSYYGGVTWSAGWQVTLTDLDGDGRTDLLLYNPTDGRWFQCITVAPGEFTFQNGNFGSGWSTTVASRTILP